MDRSWTPLGRDRAEPAQPVTRFALAIVGMSRYIAKEKKWAACIDNIYMQIRA